MNLEGMSPWELKNHLMSIDLIGMSRGPAATLQIQWDSSVSDALGNINYIGQGMGWAARNDSMSSIILDDLGMRASILYHQRIIKPADYNDSARFKATHGWARYGYLYYKGKQGAY